MDTAAITPMVVFYVYLAGLIPAAVLAGWEKAHDYPDDNLPAIATAAAWPLLLLVLGILVPALTTLVWLFEQPARFGAWLALRGRASE
jgi:hypothetical protein